MTNRTYRHKQFEPLNQGVEDSQKQNHFTNIFLKQLSSLS